MACFSLNRFSMSSLTVTSDTLKEFSVINVTDTVKWYNIPFLHPLVETALATGSKKHTQQNTGSKTGDIMYHYAVWITYNLTES